MSAIIIAAIAALFLATAYTRWYHYWSRHARMFEKSGYRPPSSSIVGRLGLAAFAYLLTFLAVGKVKVIGKEKVPARGRVVFAANHQLPCDFAMLRRGSGRHFRMLTASDQLTGFFGVLSAAAGVISVAFKNKGDGALAEAACVDAVVEPNGSLGIFPEGTLLPDNPELSEIFRPGAVRIARAAWELSGQPVQIVPVAIHYRRDRKHADWTHRFLKSMRSMFPGMRNPKVWDPSFKIKSEDLPVEKRSEHERLLKEKLAAYRKSRITNYGGVVAVGDPIDVATLPADPIEAINVVKAKVAELLALARQA